MAIAIPGVIAMIAVLLIDHGRSASAQHAAAQVEAAQAPGLAGGQRVVPGVQHSG
jgi:AAHS family benzoate transporter-like MFS transporter